MTDFSLETELIRNGYRRICGVDEVGRGALFGPVVAGAVILDPHNIHPDITDSKRIDHRKRLQLAESIYDSAVAYSIGWSWNDIIDETSIIEATRRAMAMAVRGLQVEADFLLIDGFNPGFPPARARGVVGGDNHSYSIAAASVIAKVFRDLMMESFARFYPGFDFEKNRGYCTKKHRDMVSLTGVTVFHRLSYNLGKWQKRTDSLS